MKHLDGIKATRKYRAGGFASLKWASPKTRDLVQGAGLIGTGLADLISPLDEYGTQSGTAAALKGAASGAMAGAALGPAGAIGGGAFGLITSFLGNGKRQAEKERIENAKKSQRALTEQNRVEERLAMDPLALGNPDASMYKLGGTLKGQPAGKFSFGRLPNLTPSVRVMPDITINPNKFQDGGKIKKAPVTADQSYKNASQLYDPLYNKLMKAYGAKDYNELKDNPNINKTIRQGLDNAFGYSIDDFDSGKRVVPTMSPSMKKLQETAINMPDEDVRELLKQDYGNVNIFNFKSKLPKNVSVGDALNLYREFNKLKKEGYTFENGGPIKRNRKLISNSKSKAGDMLRNADGDTILENIGEFFDPTGVSSWDDIYRTIGDGKPGSTTTEILGALPFVGKLGKISKGAKKLSPAGKLLLNTPIIGRGVDGVSDAENLTTKKKNGGKMKKFEQGGIVSSSISTNQVNGKSHAEGGVKFPEAGIELEGGESTSGDFVFSKVLGYADKHKPIAKALAKNEKRPDSLLTRKTQEALKRKEGFLKIYQEQDKMNRGIPNEIDNTASAASQGELKFGGTVKKMADGGRFRDTRGQNPYSSNGSQVLMGDGDNLLVEGINSLGNLPKNLRSYLMSGTEGLAPSNTSQTFGNTPNPFLEAPQFPSPVRRLQSPSITTTSVPADTPAIVKPNRSAATAPATASSPVARRGAITNKAVGPELQYTSPRFPGIGNPSSETSTTGIPSIDKATPAENTSEGINLKDVVANIAPFASNFANAFRKLPAPPVPITQSKLTPTFMNLDSSRAEAVRQTRGANAAAEQNLNTGNAVSAVRAANLTQQIRETNRINETEQNANADIANRFQQINAGIEAQNNQATQRFNEQLVERNVREGQLQAENLADVGNKIQAIRRDERAYELDDTRTLLTIASDPTGATIRASGDILKRIIKDPKVYSEVMEMGKQMEAQNALDRQATLARIQSMVPGLDATTILADSKVAKTADKKALDAAKVGISQQNANTRQQSSWVRAQLAERALQYRINNRTRR